MCTPLFPSVYHPQITGPGDCTPGVTPYTLTLTVKVLNNNTQGFYRVSISNVADSVDVPASRVTGRGKKKRLLALDNTCASNIASVHYLQFELSY